MEEQKTVEQGQEATQQPQAEDLMSRVTQFIEKNDSEPKSEEEISDTKFDYKDLEGIADPEAKKVAEAAYKSMQRGFNDKFQELASLRKELEGAKTDTGEKQWTPTEIESLLKDPTFLQAAQQLEQKSHNVSDSDDISYLSDVEKQKLSEIDALKQEIAQAKWQAEKERQDSDLSKKYGDYSPEAIDIITADMIAGKVTATREYLYKATKYDENVRKAYELGRKDEREGITEKTELSSPSATSSGVTTAAKLEPESGESSKSFFMRNAMSALKRASKS